jgi:hypothetical protein
MRIGIGFCISFLIFEMIKDGCISGNHCPMRAAVTFLHISTYSFGMPRSKKVTKKR